MSALMARKCEYPKFVHGRLRNCGRCVACLGRRNAELMTRVRKDLRTLSRSRLIGIGGKILPVPSTARFIHITYSDAKLPQNGSLVKKHLQNYLKRVRQRLYEEVGYRGVMSINAGEYGEKYGRPHYHVFMWRLPEFRGLFDILIKSWKESEEGKDCRITVERMRDNPIKAATYCAGYSTKASRKYDKRYNENDCDYKRRTGREPPFVTWSHGIGLQWLKRNEKMLLDNGFVILENGKRLAFPRYYRKKLRERQSFDVFRQEFLLQLDMWRKYDVKFDCTDEELGFLFAERKARDAVQKFWQKEYNKVRYRVIKTIDFVCDGGNEFCDDCRSLVEKLAFILHGDFEKWSDEDKRYVLSVYMLEYRKKHENYLFEQYCYWLRFYYCQLPRRLRRPVGKDIPCFFSQEEPFEAFYDARDIMNSFSEFLTRYDLACQEYDDKISDAVRQQGLNYRRMKELYTSSKYDDSKCYDDVVDDERDLSCYRRLRRKNKRRKL